MNATLSYGPQIPTDPTLHASLAREGRGKRLGVPGPVCCPLQAPGERDPPGCGLPLVWESLESACSLLWASGSACWRSPSLPRPLGAGDRGHAPSTWQHLSQPLFLSPLLFGRSLQDPVPRFPGFLSTYILGVFSLFLLRVFFTCFRISNHFFLPSTPAPSQPHCSDSLHLLLVSDNRDNKRLMLGAFVADGLKRGCFPSRNMMIRLRVQAQYSKDGRKHSR